MLRTLLESVKDSYDVVLIDCAPALNNLTANEFVAADKIIIPVAPHFLSFKGLDQLLGTVAEARGVNPGLSVLGALITMREKRRIGQGEVEQALRGAHELPVFETVIPKSVKAEEAPSRGESLLAYDAEGPASMAYRRLAMEVRGLL